jgi:thiosulfate dehydrogenase [quinone] large subunit
MATTAASKSTAVTTASATTGDVGGGTRFQHVSIALLRIATGFVFLWAFLDKTFGLGYSTPDARAWINGGSPTNGFLSHVDFGPFKGFFNAIAGNPIADWLFMLGLLGVGVAAIAGAGLRIAAAAGSIMMLMMWVAEWPFAQFTETGDPTGSTNPIVDYHIIYALALIVCAAYGAGRYFGVGTWWGGLPFVQRNPWLR